MDEINNVMNKLLKPIGAKARCFLIDYRDDNNTYFNHSAVILQPPGAVINPAELTDGLIRPFEEKGYTVYSVTELLDGFTEAQFVKLLKHNPVEARKHVAIIYLDFRKE